MENNETADIYSLISLIEVSENEAENGRNDELLSLIEMQESEDDGRNEVKLKNMHRAIRNWRKCLACNEKKNLHRPSIEMRRYFCTMQKIYIEKNDRVCNFHFQRQNWSEIQIKKSSTFSGKAVDEMLSLLLKPNSENECAHVDIGLRDEEFQQILLELNIPNDPNKTQIKIIKALQVYLDRLRNGHTYKQMALCYNMSQRKISKMIKCGRSLMLDKFCSKYLGYETRTRQWLVAHTTDLARKIYCNNHVEKCVTIFDGTYVYTCNTSNYSHQRKIYSSQKRRHLFKIMKVVAVDGTIIDVFGPFAATINDANIIKTVFEQTSIEHMFIAGDVVLVDRGFRDCVKFLQNKKLNVKMPEFIVKGNNGQLTTNQANRSRLVTKMRFAIEAANGRMKSKWKLFNKIIPSILTKNLMSDYKIGAALINAFGKPIICDKDDFLSIGDRMLSLVNTQNDFKRTIKSKSFKRTEKLFFQSIEPSHVNFKRFTIKQLKMISLGTYALRQAVSYIADHKKSHGQFKISVLPEAHIWAHFEKICSKENFKKPMLITAKIKSRFRSKNLHNVYILYDLNADIFLHFCECQHGQRTVGCCGHVMSIIYYFGYGQYKRNIDPAAYLNDFFESPI